MMLLYYHSVISQIALGVSQEQVATPRQIHRLRKELQVGCGAGRIVGVIDVSAFPHRAIRQMLQQRCQPQKITAPAETADLSHADRRDEGRVTKRLAGVDV